MANNRIYLRCKQCGDALYLGKHDGDGQWGYQEYGLPLSQALNDFFSTHHRCVTPRVEGEYPDLGTPFSKITRFDTNFEIAYECDDDETIGEMNL